jgi:hypothetical protein
MFDVCNFQTVNENCKKSVKLLKTILTVKTQIPSDIINLIGEFADVGMIEHKQNFRMVLFQLSNYDHFRFFNWMTYSIESGFLVHLHFIALPEFCVIGSS